MKSIIGIVARPIIDNEMYNNIGTMESYRRAIIQSGANAICIMPTQNINYEEFVPSETPPMQCDEIESIINQINLCDGILVPGGHKWYEYDEIIYKYCLKNNIPILGICMGEQIMGNINIENNNPDRDKTIRNNTNINHCQPSTNYVHKVNIDKNSKLYNIIESDQILVNSRHNYHIERRPTFKVSAIADDGIIEAIEIPNHIFAIGVQWHPESLIEFDNNSKKIFKAFIEATKSK